MKKVISLILLILWIVIIFVLSNQTGSVSKSQSNIIVKSLYNIVNTDEHTLILIVRKSAHILEYLILYLLTYNCFKKYNINNKFIFVIFCLLCSITDEIHQLFIFERTGKVIDIFIDSIGIALGFIIIEVTYGKKKKVEKDSSSKN